MIFHWYLLFNLAEFLETNLISRTLDVFLEGKGDQEITVTRGNEVSVVYKDVMLPVRFEDDNPFIRQGTEASYACYIDADDNVYLGIEAGT
jgi:hypothetical protein